MINRVRFGLITANKVEIEYNPHMPEGRQLALNVRDIRVMGRADTKRVSLLAPSVLDPKNRMAIETHEDFFTLVGDNKADRITPYTKRDVLIANSILQRMRLPKTLPLNPQTGKRLTRSQVQDILRQSLMSSAIRENREAPIRSLQEQLDEALGKKQTWQNWA